MLQQKGPILYLSYDGMTDPLGQSQVLPYLIELTKKGYSFHLISFEKEEKFALYKDPIQTLCDAHNIQWHPQKYHKKPPILSTIKDIRTMQRVANALHGQYAFQALHCRSYISAFVGLAFKRTKKAKFLFDMRGFWADERVDGGLWNLSHPIYKTMYRYFKKKERQFLSEADGVVSLTENGKKEMLSWQIASLQAEKIHVIPCAADFDVFTLKTKESQKAAKERLEIPADSFVVSYLGSLGVWYQLDEMLRFFKKVKEKKTNARFLILTNDSHELTSEKLKKHQLQEEDVKILFSPREEIASFMHASDISIFFLHSSFSKLACSPTKLGEISAMGIPVVCNFKQIGDVKELVEEMQLGRAIEDFEEPTFEQTIADLDKICQLSPNEIRTKSYAYYSLMNNVAKYEKLYTTLQ